MKAKRNAKMDGLAYMALKTDFCYVRTPPTPKINKGNVSHLAMRWTIAVQIYVTFSPLSKGVIYPRYFIYRVQGKLFRIEAVVTSQIGGLTGYPSPNLGDLRDRSVMEYYLAIERKDNAICINMDVPRDYQAE